MTLSDIGFIVAVLGLGAMFSYIQLRRGNTGFIAIGAFVFFLWRIAIEMHWWTILIFVGAAIIAGALNGIFARKLGAAPVFSMAA